MSDFLGRPDSPSESSILLDLVRLLRRRARFVAITIALSIVAGFALAYLLPPRYDARAAFIPESKESQALSGGLSALASRYGVNVASPGGKSSPDYFVALLRSRTILDAIIAQHYPTPTSPLVRDQLLRPTGDTALTAERAANSLRTATRIDVDRLSGVITVTVGAANPKFAAWLVSRYLAALNDYNLNQRRSQARSSREFLEQRVADAERDLRAAETASEEFAMRNRVIRGSPALAIDAARLERRVSFMNERYTSLARDLDNAREAEIAETPVISIIEEPRVPVMRSAPVRREVVTLALALGVAIAVGGAVLFEILRPAFSSTPTPRVVASLDSSPKSASLVP